MSSEANTYVATEETVRRLRGAAQILSGLRFDDAKLSEVPEALEMICDVLTESADELQALLAAKSATS